MKPLILGAIRWYQKTLSPDHGIVRLFRHSPACCFTPTCSEYTYEAVERYGSIRGVFLGIRRLMHCHPFQKYSQYDPLP